MSRPLLGALAAALLAGCLTPIPYQANDEKIRELGLPEARKQLVAALARCTRPPIETRTVEVTDDHLLFQEAQQGPWGPRWVMLKFSEIAKLEIYKQGASQEYSEVSHQVTVRDRGGKVVSELLFSGENDAKAFTDLLASFRRRSGRPTSGARRPGSGERRAVCHANGVTRATAGGRQGGS